MDENTSLSATHTRLFSSLIQVVENQLFDIECYLQRADYPYVISKWENNLTDDEKLKLRQKIETCYIQLRPFAHQFKLHEQTHDVRNALETKASFLWETLENSKSKRIKGSGKMNANHQQKLDQFLDDMIIRVNQIMQTLSTNKK